MGLHRLQRGAVTGRRLGIARVLRNPWFVLSLAVLMLLAVWGVYEIWFGLTQAR
jgi:hypothetical protein